MRIVVVSSRSESHSANLGADLIKALQSQGHAVDFVTHKWLDSSAQLSLTERLGKKWNRIRCKIAHALLKIRGFLCGCPYTKVEGAKLSNENEKKPPIPPGYIVSQVDGNYDFVITLFWEGMITSKTLAAIYNKLHCPILIYAVDMAPMTGGCFYFRDCENYKIRCGNCRFCGESKQNDITRANWLYKKQVYSSAACYFLGNSWMLSRASESGLFAPNRLKRILMPIDEERFASIPMDVARRDMNIPRGKKFVIFAGAVVIMEKRKGFAELCQAMKLFTDKLTTQERSEILLIFAGYNQGDLTSCFDVDVLQIGFLSKEQLVAAYSAANVYLSPSLDDAGPTMVTQSLMCGTPVVAFNVGVAGDVVETGLSGHLARLRDVEDFARGIENIYKMTCDEYATLRTTSHKIAVDRCSVNAISLRLEEIFQELS